MKKSILTILLITVLSITMLAGCAKKAAQAPSQTNNSTTQNANSTDSQTADSKSGDEDSDGIPDTVEKTYGTNPHYKDTDGDGINDKDDTAPLFIDNPIKENSTKTLPIEIKDARVEDNATADHLEITMVNNGKEDLSNFDIYYTITDKVDTAKMEAYYQKLNGLTLKAGETITLHFDNDISQPGHFYGNMNGLYSTSVNGLTFAVQLHSSVYQPLAFNVEKAVGSAEVAD